MSGLPSIEMELLWQRRKSVSLDKLIARQVRGSLGGAGLSVEPPVTAAQLGGSQYLPHSK